MNDATGPARDALQIDAAAGLIHDPRLAVADARALFVAEGVEVAQRGRGAIRIVDSALGRVVVRHYRRGGFAARISRDWFLWTGADTTRPLREFRITRKLHALGLPVVEAIAARYLRVGMGYRADLATLLLADTQTLAERLRQAQFAAGFDWAALGGLLARFHAHGVWHADLNAHNILVDPEGQILLIDFDRARQLAPFAAPLAGNLERLARSLRKLGHASLVAGAPWRQLHSAYALVAQAHAVDR